jgi:hypothetical protein
MSASSQFFCFGSEKLALTSATAEVREARLPDEFQAVRHFRDHSDDALAEITVVMIRIH